MNKKNYLWWAVGLVVLILAVYVLASLTTPMTENGTDNTAGQNEETANPANNPLSSVPAPGTTGVAAPVPDNTPPAREAKPITPEFMTAKEKETLKIDPASKVQVLQRLPDGTVGAYKVINSESDILTSF